MVTHINTGLRSWKDFLIVSKGQDRHVVVVQDRNVVLPGCEVTAVSDFWLRRKKHKGGEYWKMQTYFRFRGTLLPNSRATLPQKYLRKKSGWLLKSSYYKEFLLCSLIIGIHSSWHSPTDSSSLPLPQLSVFPVNSLTQRQVLPATWLEWALGSIH